MRQQEETDEGIVRTPAGDADDIRQTLASLERHLAEHPRLFGKHTIKVLGQARRALAQAAETMEQGGPTFTYCDHPPVSDPAKMPGYGYEPDVRPASGWGGLRYTGDHLLFGVTPMSRLAPRIRTDIEPGS
jgi:hypothetical protein